MKGHDWQLRPWVIGRELNTVAQLPSHRVQMGSGIARWQYLQYILNAEKLSNNAHFYAYYGMSIRQIMVHFLTCLRATCICDQKKRQS